MSPDTACLPELLYQARCEQLDKEKTLLAAKREFNRIRRELYLQNLQADPKGRHYPADAKTQVEPRFIEAAEALDMATIAYKAARFEANRLADLLSLVAQFRPRVKLAA
jgi:hypothetical protein